MMSDQDSSRNYGTYGNSADSSNQYYSTYTGYPSSYGPPTSTNSDQFNPSDYYPYYGQAVEKKKPSPPPPTYPTYPTNFYPAGKHLLLEESFYSEYYNFLIFQGTVPSSAPSK